MLVKQVFVGALENIVPDLSLICDKLDFNPFKDWSLITGRGGGQQKRKGGGSKWNFTPTKSVCGGGGVVLSIWRGTHKCLPCVDTPLFMSSP